MDGINSGMLNNAYPLSPERIKELERLVLENQDAFVYLNENSELCFALPKEPEDIRALAWNNAYELIAEDNSLIKKAYIKTGLDSYKLKETLQKGSYDDSWILDDVVRPEKNKYGFYFNVPYVGTSGEGEYAYTFAFVFCDNGEVIHFYDSDHMDYEVERIIDGTVPLDTVCLLGDYYSSTVDYSNLAEYNYTFSEDGQTLTHYDVIGVAQDTLVPHKTYFGETYYSADGETLIIYEDNRAVFSGEFGEINLENWQGGYYFQNYWARIYVSIDGTIILAGDRNGIMKLYTKGTPNPMLEIPQISIVGETLNITPVTGAEAYEVYCEDKLITTTEALTVDLSQYILEQNTYILVRAIGNGYRHSNFANATYGVDLVPGLYTTGAVALYEAEGASAVEDMLITSWGELVLRGIITQDNGNVTNIFKTLAGDLICPNGVTTIGSKACWQNYYITGIKLPNGCTSIGDYAFQRCYELASVIIPEGVTYIGESAFYSCYKNFTSVTIPGSVTTIGDSTFYGCEALKDVTISEGVTALSEGMFSSSGVENITLPDSLISIGAEAFSSCDFDTLVLPNNVTSIGNSAFRYCSSLVSITLPNSITDIGNSVFSKALEKIYFNGTVNEWENITKGDSWNSSLTSETEIICLDGNLCVFCVGGTTTSCQEQAICEKCGNAYGEYGPHNIVDGVCTVCGIEGTVIESEHNPYTKNEYTILGTWDYSAAKSVNITMTYQTANRSNQYCSIAKGVLSRAYYNQSGYYLDTSGKVSWDYLGYYNIIKFGGPEKTTVTFENVDMLQGSVIFYSSSSAADYYGVHVTVIPNY